MPIKTRAEIYRDAAELLRIIGMYPGLAPQQLCRFFPGKEAVLPTILSNLERQGRIIQQDGRIFSSNYSLSEPVSKGLICAVWVLLDFIEYVEFHTKGDFPVKIVFFAKGEEYEIIYVGIGQESLISCAAKQSAGHTPKRIVIVESSSQISALVIQGIAGFCTVSDTGQIDYYIRKTGGV